MRELAIYFNKLYAGRLIEKSRQEYIFRYDDLYYNDSSKPAISLTLPKNKQEHSSNFLFPVFYNMLSEGVNLKLQSTHLRIDEDDSFGLLSATAQFDTIGAITVKPLSDEK